MECVCEIETGVITFIMKRRHSCGFHCGNIKITFSCDMTRCSMAERHWRFCGKCRLHFHCSTLKTEAASFFETLVTLPQTRSRHFPSLGLITWLQHRTLYLVPYGIVAVSWTPLCFSSLAIWGCNDLQLGRRCDVLNELLMCYYEEYNYNHPSLIQLFLQKITY
jgi:hypothetical protein